MRVPDGGKPIKVGDTSFIYKGVYHPIHWLGTKPYRPRVETLVTKNGDDIYAHIKSDARKYPSDKRAHRYSIPGGSIDADSSMIGQAEAETNEEALISIWGIYHSGIQYYETYDDSFLLKGGDMPMEYVGSVSDVYVAKYSGEYDKRLVEEKDLDPDMAEKGKFHKIVDIVDILRSEHVQALLQSPYIDTKVKAQLLMRTHVAVGESTDQTKINMIDHKIYHGSTCKIDSFKPMSLDLGNAFQEPGWSTFCFLSYHHAKQFGAMRAFQQLLENADVTSDNLLKDELTVELLGEQLVVSNDCISLLQHTHYLTDKVTYYVYTIDAEHLDTCIGNDPYLPEVTFREEGILPIKTDTFETSIYELRNEIGVLDDSINNIDTYRQADNDYSEYLTHNYRLDPVRKKLEVAVKSGDLKPGDDVTEYMDTHGLSFESDDIHLPDIVVELDEPVLESFLKPVLEEKYPLACYGLPKRKGYPMPDEKHVLSAIKFFNHADPKEEKELAANINKKIREYHMTDIHVGPDNRFRKYYNPKRKVVRGKKLPKTGKSKKTSLMESVISKRKSKGFKPKGQLSLKTLRKNMGTAGNLKSKYPKELLHVRDSATVIIWTRKQDDAPVAFIAAEKKPDGIWCTALEVMDTYRGYGLSRQVIDVGIHELQIKKLSVEKSNKLAQYIYKDKFKAKKSDNHMTYMELVTESTLPYQYIMEAKDDKDDKDKKDDKTKDTDNEDEYNENEDENDTDNKDDEEDENTDDNTGEDVEEDPEDDADEEPLGGEPTSYMDDIDDEGDEDPDDGDDNEPDESGNDADEPDEPTRNNRDDSGDEEPLGGEPTSYTDNATENDTDDSDDISSYERNNQTDEEPEQNLSANDANSTKPDDTEPEYTSDTTGDTTGTETEGTESYTESEVDEPNDAEPDEEPLGGEPTNYTEDTVDDENVSEDNPDDTAEDTGEDTTDTEDTTDDTDTGETDKNKGRFDNKELKNYFLLNDFISIHELTTDTLESLNGVILKSPEANMALSKVVKNVREIEQFTENFIQFQFSNVDYSFNLYYYNVITSVLKMNLNVLTKIMKLGDTN